MGTLTAKSLIDLAAIQLIDISGVRWTRAELLAWLNDGLRQIVLLQPNATNTVASVKLASGTRQTLPSGGWLLLSVNRNMGLNGSTPGRAIRIVSRRIMDSVRPNWHSDQPGVVVENYIYDLQDQTAFYVYPPSPGNNYVELNYSKQPDTLTSENDVIPVFDVYQSILIDYMLYRACSKDAEYAPGVALAQSYAASFIAALGGKETTEIKTSPEQTLFPRSPTVAGSQA